MVEHCPDPNSKICGCSSVVERCPDKTEVEGSIPSSHTMEEKESNLNKKSIWWKPALEVFSEVSAWIAVPVILATVAGKALDQRYGTEPWLLIGLVCLAFLVSSYGIVRAVRRYAAKIRKEDSK